MIKLFARAGLLITSLLCSATLQAQVIMSLLFGDKLNTDELAFGIHLDYGSTKPTNLSSGNGFSSFNIGLFMNYKLNEHWHINGEAMAKWKKGAEDLDPYSLGDAALDQAFADGQYQRTIGYLGLPVTVQYYAAPRWFIESGPSVALRLKAVDLFRADKPQGALIFDNGSKDRTNAWDLGMLFGTGTTMGKGHDILVGLRYSLGFSDAFTDMDGRQAHRGWNVYANIPIGRAKAEAKRAAKAAE